MKRRREIGDAPGPSQGAFCLQRMHEVSPRPSRCQDCFASKLALGHKNVKSEALPGIISLQSGGVGEKDPIRGTARPYFGPKWARGRKSSDPRRCQALFWSKVGARQKKVQSEALPGLISVQSGALGRKRSNPRRCQALFRSKVGAWPKKVESEALPGLILVQSGRVAVSTSWICFPTSWTTHRSRSWAFVLAPPLLVPAMCPS